MSKESRGAGEPLTAKQRSHVRTPHAPNKGVAIDFSAIAKKMENSACSIPEDFDWEMFGEVA